MYNIEICLLSTGLIICKYACGVHVICADQWVRIVFFSQKEIGPLGWMRTTIYNESIEDGKDKESIQSSTTPDSRYHMRK